MTGQGIVLGATTCAIMALAGCGSSSSAGAPSSAKGVGASPSTPEAWATAYCKNLATYETGASSEAGAFNATTPPDAQGIKDQELAHIQKYLSLVQPVIDAVNGGPAPPVPDGSGYVKGYSKAFTTLQTTLKSQLGDANALDPAADAATFNSALQDISTALNAAFSKLTSDWNSVDAGFTNARDNPLVHAMNNDANCTSFRNGAK